MSEIKQELDRLRDDPETQGKYAVVYGVQIASIQPTIRDALTYGYETFKSDDFATIKLTREPVSLPPIIAHPILSYRLKTYHHLQIQEGITNDSE